MKVYVPFFIVSICIIVFAWFLYSPINDVEIKRNMYNYSNKSYEEIKNNKYNINKYYLYIDCHVNNKDFVEKNIEYYKVLSNCDGDINKVNYLVKYYKPGEVNRILYSDFDYKLITNKNYKDALKYITDKNFISENFNRYLSYDGSKSVLNVNLNYDLEPYQNYNEVNDVELLTVINKYNKLNNLNKLTYCKGYYVYNSEMCDSLDLFFKELSKENIIYKVEKVHSREDLFDEHATGLALNISYDFSYENLVEKIAMQYGFILRYKDNYQDVLVDVENGHYRFVGEYSEEIYNSKLSLDEFNYVRY